jgi:hypothetical protein
MLEFCSSLTTFTSDNISLICHRQLSEQISFGKGGQYSVRVFIFETEDYIGRSVVLCADLRPRFTDSALKYHLAQVGCIRHGAGETR